MLTITIITIVVVALLTAIIFGLAWIAYVSYWKIYKLEVQVGKYDEEIRQQFAPKNKVLGLIGTILSYLALVIAAGLFITGIIYKVNNENFTINNHTILVIGSNSMAEYYNEELKADYETKGYANYQFKIGDICMFEKVSDDTELVKGEVYGYKYKDIIITHRLVDIYNDLYEFRGDNNYTSDPFVKRGDIIYRYTGNKVPSLGAFILYAQSYFGIWSIIGIIGIAISSEIIYRKVYKINRDRMKELEGANEE